MRRNALHGFARREVVGELDALLLLAVDHRRRPLALIPQIFAQAADELGVFREVFHQDPARPFERGGRIGHALFGVHVRGGGFFRHERAIAEQRERQRFESRFARDLRLRAALRLVGQIQVFEPRLGVRLVDRGGQLRRQLALLFDALENRGAALFHLAQIRQPLFERAQLRVVEAAGRFFPIAGDERNGGFLVEERHRRGDLRQADAQFVGNALIDRNHLARESNRRARAHAPSLRSRRDPSDARCVAARSYCDAARSG